MSKITSLAIFLVLKILPSFSFLVLTLFQFSWALQGAKNISSDDWDVSIPRGKTRTISFTTQEGTWMSVDISPDGKWVIFDLLDHIYRVPSKGGNAKSLTQKSGIAVNFHPRYSPDGQYIAFISDRKGQNNLWIMNADGSEPRSVFLDDYVQVSMPTWTPDGNYIIVKRRNVQPDDRSGDNGIWVYHVKGGTGVQLIGDDEGGSSPSWPSTSKDGQFLYYHVIKGRGAAPMSGNLQLRRYNFETGEILELSAGDTNGPALARLSSGGAFAPKISPDGRWLAFGRKIPDGAISYKGHELSPRSTLWLRDLITGVEQKVMDPISFATRSSRGILPGYAWGSDGKEIFLSQGGKIRKLQLESKKVNTIPFKAKVKRVISEQAAISFRITDDPFQPKFLRWSSLSPDGSMLTFQAVGKVWVMELPRGTPRLLIPDNASTTPSRAEFSPAWSPDGNSIAFSTLDDSNQGDVWIKALDGGESRKITNQPAFYTHLSWSPKGHEILATRGGGATGRGRTVGHNAYFDIVQIPVVGGSAKKLTTISKLIEKGLSNYARRAIPSATYGPDDRIFFPIPSNENQKESNESITAFVSVDLDGGNQRTHLTFPQVDIVVPSPSGKYVAFDQGDNVYVVPFPWRLTGANSVHVSKSDTMLPVSRLTYRGGLYPRWHDDKILEYGNANWHYTYDTSTGKKDSTHIEFTVPVYRPKGKNVLVGARIITMAQSGPQIIEKGKIVTNNGRIECVGKMSDCKTSNADNMINVEGKTIMPGIIDMHAHHYRENRGHRPPNDYEVALYLAYGITTNLDNSMWAENIFPTAERIRAGRMIGPRTFSTGDPIYQGDAPNHNKISNYKDAKDEVLRLKSWGAVAIKQYSNPRRDQRQWIIDSAREANLMVTGHWNPGVAMDGHTGIEHAREFVPLYQDMTSYYGESGIFYTPTMVVSGPGPSNLEYFFAKDNVWQQVKQRQWMPWRLLTFLRWRTLRPDTDYSFSLVAQGMKDIIEAGGYGVIGGHGEHHGLGTHWEIWMASEALGPMGALKVATMHGARFLGAEKDVGSIEKGKLADLLVLNSSPLEDIQNTVDIQFVMLGGTVYDATNLDEIWPMKRPFGNYYWLDSDVAPTDTRPTNYWKNP